MNITPKASAPAHAPYLHPVGKPWWQSKAILGAVVAILASLLNMVGVSVEETTLTTLVPQIAAAAGGVLAIYGRIKATQPLGK